MGRVKVGGTRMKGRNKNICVEIPCIVFGGALEVTLKRKERKHVCASFLHCFKKDF